VIEVKEYVDTYGRSPYAKWFDRLNARSAAKVATALVRMEQGNLTNAKSIGGGVFEYRIHFGPGYRIYFGKDGDTLIILLGGGTKKRQQKDIEIARDLWREYRQRKQQES
jgi:putative addiction module killer protein